MIALSSRALGLRIATIAEVCDSAHALGFQGVGVASSPFISGAGLRRGGTARTTARVVALRVGCRERRSGIRPVSEDAGALDKARNAAAVKEISEHLTLAAAAGCSLAVLDAGTIDAPGLDERFRHAEGLADRGDDCDELLEELRRLAAPRRDAHLERLCQTIHGLVKSHPGVTVALTPAWRPHGLLVLTALEDVLAELRGLPVGVWIDAGHAKARERLGGDAMARVLPAVAPRIVGLDAHDCQRLKEHLTPGEGEVDWKLVAENLPRNAVPVLDVEPASAASLRESARAAEQLLSR